MENFSLNHAMLSCLNADYAMSAALSEGKGELYLRTLDIRCYWLKEIYKFSDLNEFSELVKEDDLIKVDNYLSGRSGVTLGIINRWVLNLRDSYYSTLNAALKKVTAV